MITRAAVVRRRRPLLGALAAFALLATTSGVATGAPAAGGQKFVLPKITHVWNIVLENQNYASTFGDPAADPYLAQTLRSQGALLTNYYGIGHESNDNYLALVSGQPPNPDTQSDCQVFSGFTGGMNVNGIEAGVGCVYPQQIKTIGDLLTQHRLSWKAYEQDMGNDPAREAAACGHPALNAQDNTQSAEVGDAYATRHDPFVYFQSVINRPAYCRSHVVALGTATGALPPGAVPGETGLATDLQSAATTPNYSFITPNLCYDGHDFPCKDPSAGTSAMANTDDFLRTWVPLIMASAAYQDGGLIEITYDESDGPQSDSTACCGETPGPNSPLPGITGPGGGRVGAVLISPFITPGTTSDTPYNHYSTLATDAKLFRLRPLGEAGTVSASFGPDVFTAATP